MARAQTASACVQSDSIKGLAQSIAKPAYHRLLLAESTLRRAVPILIIAFLVTICIGAAVQVLDHHRQKLTSVKRNLVALADILTERLDRTNFRRTPADRIQELLPTLMPAWGIAAGRHIILADAEGRIVARMPLETETDSEKLIRFLGSAQLLASSGMGSSVAELTSPTGTPALATIRPIKSLPGQLILIQEQTEAVWQSDATLSITLSATTGFVVLILGFAFHWQSARAREADVINDAVRGRIDTALNRGRCGLWDWDLARGRIFWSHSMFDMLGLDGHSDLLTFGDVNALICSDDIDLYDLANQLMSGQVSHIDHDFRMRHADGHWIWLRARCEVSRQHGEPGPHLIGIAVDITEQKSLAERSIEADLRLRDAVETISEAFVLWDADNRLVLCNSHFQNLHKLPDSAVVPGTSYETIAEVGRMPEIRNRSNGVSEFAPGARTFEAQLDDGSWLNISERRTKDGGFVSVGTDITKIKQHEHKLIDNDARLRASVADLQHSQQKLERQAHELADLAEKYEQERNRAEEANEAKSKFLANMSHELRTPLNAIIGFSEIMCSEMFGSLGSEKYQEYCKDIYTSGQYLLEVINDILDMSKIEAGRVELDLESVCLAQTLQESLRVASSRASSKYLQIHSDIPDDLPIVADRRAIMQIAINLLSNAVKFTPDNGRITVRGRLRQDQVVMLIADTGIGIAPESLARLGRPFEQVESQLTKRYQGSGLGLAIAKTLTALHGGAMRLKSRPGAGTVVMVTLPRDARASHRPVRAAA